MKSDLKPLRLSTTTTDLFNIHPYVLWDQSLTQRSIRYFISPYSLATYLHVNGAIEMYYMGLRSHNTLCCKVLDQTLFNALIASLPRVLTKSYLSRLKFKLILWLGSRELLTIEEST